MTDEYVPQVGDTVAVTAKVKARRSDGAMELDPVGFEIDWRDEEVFTVDPPTLVERAFRPGDKVMFVKEEGSSEVFYGYFHKHLDEGKIVVQTTTSDGYKPDGPAGWFSIADAGLTDHHPWVGK